MSPSSTRHAADGSARHSADPSAARRDHLRLVDDTERASSTDTARDETFQLVQQHLQLASRLGVGPLTVAERARSMLEPSCPSWRRAHRCDTHDGQPHEACLLAQYHHDLLLLEHGLLGPLEDPPAPASELAYSSPKGLDGRRSIP